MSWAHFYFSAVLNKHVFDLWPPETLVSGRQLVTYPAPNFQNQFIISYITAPSLYFHKTVMDYHTTTSMYVQVLYIYVLKSK